MKMGKKVREYKAGDFIFAKVKGYPAWPARVQRMNGKKYFVYFYGTGETANLPPNMIFDYAENKDKFLTKTVKRRDFNDGVKQIEYDFANNVPLEQVIGVATEAELPEGANDTANETANETVDESMADTTAADETMADESTQNDTGIEDSDETGALVIDEGKQAKAGRKSTAKTPATPKAKEAKTPRGRGKKDEEGKEEAKEDEKKEEELVVSRSGRKIRPKRYIDEHTEENTTLPSPAPKKRRGASPVEKDKENKEKESKEKDKDKNIKHFNAVTQGDLEDLKEPFTPDDPEKENIIIAYLPMGQYIGIKLFQSRPNSFKNEAARLQWDKQAASNALTLKSQLEKGHISPHSVMGQLVMDLNLTDEEKATLDKDRETEEKKSRVQYLKVEMKLMELDTKIKTCLCLEKADTELCLKLMDELMELNIKPLMLLKHPSTLETIKRMRAYVGNTPSWELSESAALQFSQQAHKIRKQADTVYNNLKKLFPTPEGLSFWEFFTERVAQFKKATEKLTTEEVLEIVHDPLELSTPTSHTMKASVEAANEEEKKEKETAEETEKEKAEEQEEAKKPKTTPAKAKKALNNTPVKTPAKRQSSRNKPEEKDKEEEEVTPATEEKTEADKTSEQNQDEQTKDKDSKESNENDAEETEVAKDKKDKKNTKDSKANKEDDKSKDNNKDKVTKDKSSKDKDKNSTDKNDTEVKESDAKEKTPDKSEQSTDDSKKESSVEEEKKESSKESSKEVEKEKSTEKSDKEDKKEEKDKTEDEPRAKRSRESKKTDPPPRSPTKRKSKF
ncbi:PC4 and SFRS1-interacting protein-like [Maniola jurtina]|uniref:PC4 and SFRS1-interacting protein-like n=1 Tax=Maniola jurtina TaxID=191418 RepID=UPI001E68A7AB|nr:PC4 and SFRS1-interacting protein-like [Maniola jurtina]XP_045782387.1 PC4 and SFRS1-interacting protein-like [Maniola jurtina]XP_045782388.1 PC4 and SFRS1-interacting protein-like [Maniola jurtina]